MPEVNTQPQVTNAVFPLQGRRYRRDGPGNQGKDAFALITNVAPARQAEYAEVQDQVLTSYTTAESSRLAEEAAKNAAAAARKGQSLDALAKQYGGQLKTAAPFTIDGAAEGIGAATTLAAAFKGNMGDMHWPDLRAKRAS